MSLEAVIRYTFQQPDLLVQAITHKSYANENTGTGHNEVLEFIGDSVVNLAMAHYLMEQFPKDAEGDLSRKRASLVNETTLYELAVQLQLDRLLRLGRGETKTQAGKSPRLLSGCLEALFGAVYLDGGFSAAGDVIRKLFEERVRTTDWSTPFGSDFKTRFQEAAQKKFNQVPLYRVVSETGPEHSKTFEVEAVLNGEIVGRGTGLSKKQAEQVAAKAALENFA